MSRLFVKQMGGLSPKTVIIERQLKLYQALKDTLSPKTEVLFCYYHIVRTLKTQYAFLERDKPEEFKQITDLPMIESPAEFQK